MKAAQAKPLSDDHLQVYSGKHWKGSVLKSSGSYLAYSAAGKKIGRFPTVLEASRAVLAAPASAPR